MRPLPFVHEFRGRVEAGLPLSQKLYDIDVSVKSRFVQCRFIL